MWRTLCEMDWSSEIGTKWERFWEPKLSQPAYYRANVSSFRGEDRRWLLERGGLAGSGYVGEDGDAVIEGAERVYEAGVVKM